MNITLEQLRSVDICSVDPTTLIDIRSVSTDIELSQNECLKDFVRQIKNPYCFTVDGVIVKLDFSDKMPSFTERFESLIQQYQ
jgi:hypothetical protein